MVDELFSGLLLDIVLTKGERVLGEDFSSVASLRFKLSDGNGELGQEVFSVLSLDSVLVKGGRDLWGDFSSLLSLDFVLTGGEGDCGETSSALLLSISWALGDENRSGLLSLSLGLVGGERDLDGGFSSLLSLDSGVVEGEREGDLVGGMLRLLPLLLSPERERGLPWRRRSTGSGHDCLNPGFLASHLSIVREVGRQASGSLCVTTNR